jgi:hypothetical protein
MQGEVTTAAPTYTTGKYGLLSLNTSGGLRVDGSGVTQPVSGAVNLQSSGTALTNTGGALNVNVTNSSGGGNAAASTTGSAVPASAGYTGVINNSGNLVGLPGYADQGGAGSTGTQLGLMSMMLQQSGGNYAWAERCDASGSHIVTHAPSTYAVCALSAAVFSAQAAAVNIKATAGNLYGFAIISSTATAGFIEFFNTATTATSGPVLTLPIAANGTLIVTPAQMALLNFSAGIAINVATAVGGTSEITWTGTVWYK